MESDIFDTFHKASVLQFKHLNSSETEIFVDEPGNENYTILARPNAPLLGLVTSFQEKLQSIDPRHFYYPSDRLHMTLVGGITAARHPNEVIEAVRPIFQNLSLLFRIWGTTSNTSAASFSFYPQNFSLHDLRERTRRAVGEHGTDFTIWIPEYEYVGWMNFVRYQTEPKEELLAEIGIHLEEEFGAADFTRFEIVKTSGLVLNPKWTYRIHLFDSSV